MNKKSFEFMKQAIIAKLEYIEIDIMNWDISQEQMVSQCIPKIEEIKRLLEKHEKLS